MTLRKSVAYSAVALAFAAGSAFAQTSTERDLSISANPKVGVDANAGVNNPGVNTSSQASGQASGSTSAQASSGETEAGAAAGGTASGEVKQENKEEKKTGLDRADEVAGEHGKHGRDNARAKQDR
jgi:hypothetical protein